MFRATLSYCSRGVPSTFSVVGRTRSTVKISFSTTTSNPASDPSSSPSATGVEQSRKVEIPSSRKNVPRSSDHHSRSRFPKRIILLRHGESLGNVDESLYGEIPDWKIPLTRRGEKQCLKAATDLYALTKNESIFCYCSPYTRTKESWNIISQYLREQGDVHLIGTREEPRIAEQQFGNFQNPRKVRTAKIERRTFGRFFYRFPNGEAGLDVYNRVSSFLATASRDLLQFQDSGADMSRLNIVIVTHGLTLRLLLMRYFQLSVEEFEESYNPQNAKLVVMDRIDPEEEEREENGSTDGSSSSSQGVNTPSTIGGRKSFFRLQDEAKDALNLKGDVSSEKPVFFRGDALDQMPYDLGEEV